MTMRSATIDGVLLVDKPAGVTSHDVVATARRSLGIKRIGHTGTLDPFATGLLVLLLGKATRLLPYVDGEPKVYEATIELGAETDTDDNTGTVTRTAQQPTEQALRDGMRALTGEIEQVPPAYSAKKIAGTRAYAAARRGTPLELPPSRVTVHEWAVLRHGAGRLVTRISCSGGTYVRALARDLGRLAGSAAHLSALRRTRSGTFEVAHAVAFDALEAGDASPLDMRSAIPGLPAQDVAEDEIHRVLHGNTIAARVDAPTVALIEPNGSLVALAARDGASLQPRVVLRDS
jgi:tRNA pseudouridine55 synthase